MVRLTSLFSGLAALSFGTIAAAASLQQVSNFGSNPSGIQMYIYVPANLQSKPAVIVASHPCGGSAQEYFGATKFPSYADSMGFILIYPSTTKDYSCWDTYSSATLTRNGGGDSEGIVQMVDYVIQKYNADSTKVYATGSSSGAMMTSVLACVYPDVFNAGACFSGVPCACFKGSPAADPYMSDQSCARDQKGYSAAQWTSLALAPYSSYTGKRTRMQIWHGTADTLVYYGNLIDQLEQWSGVLGVSFSHNVTNNPASGYTEMVYGDGTQLVGYSGAGVGHFVPTFEQPVLQFFGITSGGGGGTTTPSGPTSTATSTHTTSAPAPTGGSIAKYGQCGGTGWTGSGSCASGSTCQVINPYYSQCL